MSTPNDTKFLTRFYNVVHSAGRATPVEDFHLWSERLTPGQTATGELRADLAVVYDKRVAAGRPLSPVEKAAGLATGMAFRLTPPALFQNPECGENLGLQLAAEIDRVVLFETGATPSGRGQLAWLLRAVCRFRAEVEPHLSPAAKDALAAVAALAHEQPQPNWKTPETPFARYLRELSVKPAAFAAPGQPLWERVCRFLGGNRFTLTRVGLMRAALVVVLMLIGAAGWGVYRAARQSIADFRDQNQVPLYESSLIVRK